MEVSPEEILKYVESQERFKGEVASYWESMKRLPQYDYSRFYAHYPEYSSIITQGDGLGDMAYIRLPDPEVLTGKAMVLSSTCDIALENQRKFTSRIIYAPLLKLESYEAELRAYESARGKKKYTSTQVDTHIDEIRKQKVGQVFYLPKGKYLDEEAIVFFDTLCSCDNESISREHLEAKRMFSLSAYGWHIFLVKLSLFFTRATDQTVELRFSSSN